MDKKYIRFIDSNYNTLFNIKDGDSIRIRFGDGQVEEFKCQYVDETHTKVGTNTYHICQFAEVMERNGNKYEPVKEIGDLDFYPKRFYDHENIGPDGKLVPYYELFAEKRENGDYRFAYCLNPSSENKSFCYFHPKEDFPKEFVAVFSPDIESYNLDNKLSSRFNNIVQAIKEEQFRTIPSLDDTISDCRDKAVKQHGNGKVIEKGMSL